MKKYDYRLNWGFKMNKKILKILICTFVFIIGISAVSAIEINSTDEVALQSVG